MNLGCFGETDRWKQEGLVSEEGKARESNFRWHWTCRLGSERQKADPILWAFENHTGGLDKSEVSMGNWGDRAEGSRDFRIIPPEHTENVMTARYPSRLLCSVH